MCPLQSRRGNIIRALDLRLESPPLPRLEDDELQSSQAFDRTLGFSQGNPKAPCYPARIANEVRGLDEVQDAQMVPIRNRLDRVFRQLGVLVFLGYSLGQL